LDPIVPLRLLLATALAALAALSTAAVASAQGTGGLERKLLVGVQKTGPVEVQLDADPALERVASRKLDPFRFAPRVEDDCLGARRLGPVNDMVTIESVALKGAPGSILLFVTGSSGASGQVADFRLHRLGPQTNARGCPTLRTVFAFPDLAFPLPRPRRGTEAGSFSAQVRFAGGEIRVRTTEGLYRPREAGCCPSFVRTTDWRMDRERDRYVPGRSRTVRASRG
jgi:hypothetical protein